MSMRIPGLAKPWCWIQPHGTDEILRRLLDAREFSVDERERENMCSVAHGEIVRLRNELREARAQSTEDHAAMLAALGASMELREELLQCRSKLALAAESEAGDSELIADLVALASLAYSFSKYSADIHFFEPRRPTDGWLDGHIKLIEDLRPKLEAAIARATNAQAPEFHDDKPDGRPDMHISTEPGDLDTFGRPMRPGT